MSFLTGASFGVVLLVALYLFAFGAVSAFASERAQRFLLGFAGSVRLHLLELLLRVLVGAALLRYAPYMQFAALFQLVGWALLLTSAGLLLIPWRWHQAFTQRSVPQAMRYPLAIAISSWAFGAFLLYAVFG